MLQVPRRTGFSGPTLVRLLARLADADAPAPASSLSSQLSQWLGWADAIALSSALKNAPAIAASAVGGTEAQECARVRARLAGAIAEDAAPAGRRRGPPRPSALPDPVDAQVDYAVQRQRYLTLQQTMESTIGSLRAALRAALSARTPALAKLAMVDAVMERVLGTREQSLLGAVPNLLEPHFQRLRQAEAAALEHPAQAAGQPAAIRPGAWLGVFRKDMQSVLLAELEIRWQPVEGLLAALQDS